MEINKNDGKILLWPVSGIPKDERYFHTRQWQKKEAQADKDIKAGSVYGPFDNAKDGTRDLKN